MKNGIIRPSSKAGKEIEFTSDLFEGWLWKTGDRMWISFIVSRKPGRGHLSRLFDTIENLGLKVAVPTPFAHMAAILSKKGFVPHIESEGLEVWEKPVVTGQDMVEAVDKLQKVVTR